MSEPIVWRIHLASPPGRVHEFLSTDAGRARFWAESAVERDGRIDWVFPNGVACVMALAESSPPTRFAVRYFGGSTATFTLDDDGSGGTDLTLRDEGVPEAWRQETYAGWISVLLALKAAVDFGVDLRNHDRTRTWDERYADN